MRFQSARQLARSLSDCISMDHKVVLVGRSQVYVIDIKKHTNIILIDGQEKSHVAEIVLQRTEEGGVIVQKSTNLTKQMILELLHKVAPKETIE